LDVVADPSCLKNLTASPAHKKTLEEHRRNLEQLLKAESDPRVPGTGGIFDSYPRHSPMRPELGGFAEEGKYNPAFSPKRK
jgi:N-sulfoglucosamine sulfohydrolase